MITSGVYVFVFIMQHRQYIMLSLLYIVRQMNSPFRKICFLPGEFRMYLQEPRAFSTP